MEYAGEGSNLMTLIKENKSQEESLSETDIAKLMFKLISGISYLHDKGICHRDIKPSNTYVTKNLEELKILDFNVALRFQPNQKLFGATGEELYSAPELTTGKAYDQSVDMWSAGVVLY